MALLDQAPEINATSADTQLPSESAVLAQARSENFPVALWLLGPRMRRDLLALYGFARLVDDTGDEVAGDRPALLDELEAQLEAPSHPLMRRVVDLIEARELQREPFRRLIAANRVDQVDTEYSSLTQLYDYCMLSAAPVGEIVLSLFGAASAERVALSDRVCAALQVIEHLGDIDEDRARGRRYIGDFDAHAEAHRLLGAGPPLVRSLRGRARLAVAGFVAGGRQALADLERPGTKSGSFAGAFLRAWVGR